jgi:hypothetical protein
MATRLEVKHYHEVMRRMPTLSIDQFSRRSVSGDKIGPRTVAVLAELDRFGYVPSKDALLVAIDEGDCDPPLTREQMLAVHSDIAYLWGKLS